MTDREILIWIHQRLVKVHGESKYVDYMHALRDVIYAMPKNRNSRGNVVTMNSMKMLDEIESLELTPNVELRGAPLLERPSRTPC